MWARAAFVLGALALVACGAPRPSPSAADADALRERALALRRARVWREPPRPIPAADLAANPEGPGAFSPDADVACTFRLRPSSGWSPKFDCTLPSGEVLRVKYGHNSVEVFGEVAATRLLTALGFGADRMYVVRSVRCMGCPLHPFPRLKFWDAVTSDDGREVRFDVADVERKMPGRPIKAPGHSGWTWPELDQIDPAAGGSSRAEVDALRLMAVFLADWDAKDPNQRLVCLDEPPSARGCSEPLAYLQDVGETFGPRGVDLEGWAHTPVWADAATCRLSMKDLPYRGAGFGEPRIAEAGRRFLGDRLRQLSHAQVVALFTGARFPAYLHQSPEGQAPESWARAFEDRVRQIVDRPPCPD
jgi:hypothetical protein